MKKKKITKIPKLFLKPYTEKTFNKKILKRIHIPEDKRMIQEIFKQNKENKLEIIPELSQDILVKLKPLAKSIKKNAGFVSKGKVIILVIILGSILLFNLIFKNSLITNGLESGMEAIFKADVEIEQLNFSLVKGILSYQSLTIADAEHPFFNLIETGPAQFGINMAELTRRRVRIEEMSLSEVHWNTPRAESGALAEKELSNEENNREEIGAVNEDFNLTVSEDSAPADNQVSESSFSIEDFDYMALIDSQTENLQSLKLIEEGNQEILSFKTRWTTIYDEKEAEISGLIDEVNALTSFSLENIRTLEDGQAAIAEIQGLYNRTIQTKEDLLSLQDDFLTEKNNLINLANMVESAGSKDLNYLGGFLDFSSGNIQNLASNAAEIYLGESWSTYYSTGMRALEFYEKLMDQNNEKKKDTEEPERGQGEVVSFPSPDHPTFLIENITLSGGDETLGDLEVEIHSISNDPDKLSLPSTFSARWTKDQTAIVLDGQLDARKNIAMPFEMNILSPENTLSLDSGIPALQIASMNSLATIQGTAAVLSDQDAVLTQLNIMLNDIKIQQSNSQGLIAEAVREILGSIPEVTFDAEILTGREGLKSIDIVSDIDAILADRIGGYIREMAEEMETALINSFNDFLGPYIEENDLIQSSLDILGVESLDQISSIEDAENLLNQKKGEYENQARAITDEINREIERQIAATEAAARAEAARLEEEANAEIARMEEEARIQAEAAAADIAAQALGAIKIPGF